MNGLRMLRVYWAIGAIIWALFILFATIANAQTLNRLLLKDIFGFDKPIHMFLFGVQLWLIIQSVKYSDRSSNFLFYAFLGTVGYGILTELMQGWLTTTRYLDIWDMLANALGCFLVWLTYRNTVA